MVVLQLGPYPPPHGGVQTNLVAIRDYLRARGMAAPVINLTRHRRRDSDDVYYPQSARQVLTLLRQIPADIIHIHLGGFLSGRLLALCAMCAMLPRRRVVLTFHSGGYPSKVAGDRIRAWSLRGIVFRRLDAVIAVNAEIGGLFARLGVAPSRIHQICPYSPVSVREDLVLTEPLRSFCETHSPLLTTVGLLEPEYDLALQIRALEVLRQQLPGAGLVVVGSGSLESELRHHISSSPERDHVLLCGDVPHPLTVRLIAASDVFLRTTLYDGDSVSVREALQLGVPVIATDNGMRPVGVHLIPRSDPEALRQAITTALSERSARVTPSPRGDDGVERVFELYAALLGNRVRAFRRTAPI
jgi:glycosyltransferase involved in cell wall biosynthesis